MAAAPGAQYQRCAIFGFATLFVIGRCILGSVSMLFQPFLSTLIWRDLNMFFGVAQCSYDDCTRKFDDTLVFKLFWPNMMSKSKDVSRIKRFKLGIDSALVDRVMSM